MSLAACAICDTPITPENDSREHIILNAVGADGRFPDSYAIDATTPLATPGMRR